MSVNVSISGAQLYFPNATSLTALQKDNPPNTPHIHATKV